MAAGRATRRRVHVDTCILLPAAGLDLDRDACVEARSYLMRDGPQLAASSTALGEFLLIACRDWDEEAALQAVGTLHRWLVEERLVTYVLGTHHSIFEHSRELMLRDAFLTPADAQIIACAIADEDAEALATSDGFASRAPLIDYLRENDRRFALTTSDTRRAAAGGNARSSRGATNRAKRQR